MKVKLIIAAIALMSFTCCNKDNSSNGNNNSVITTVEGKQVLLRQYNNQSNTYTFGYDLLGRPTKVSGIIIDYDKGELLSATNHKTIGTVTINKSGFITEIKIVESNTDENYEIKYSCSYNKAGGLVKYKYEEKRSETKYESGKPVGVFSDSEIIDGELIWNNSSITGLKVSGLYNSSDGDKTETVATVTYTSDIRNLVNQHACNDIYLADVYEDLYLAGLLGIAPNCHPSKCVAAMSGTYNNEYQSVSYDVNFEYLFNNNETISREFNKNGSNSQGSTFSYQDFIPVTKSSDLRFMYNEIDSDFNDMPSFRLSHSSSILGLFESLVR